jgi:nitrite reductase (NADH) small subunit
MNPRSSQARCGRKEEPSTSGVAPTVNITDCSKSEDGIALGRIDLIPLGEGRCFRLGALQVALFRPRDGAVFALEARCPHLGGPLADGLIGAGVVVCPLHGWRFRLADGTGIDNDLAARSYPVEVRDGCIWLRGVEKA